MKTTKQSPWSRLDAIMKADPEPTGPGWFTVEECAVRYDMSLSRARASLNAKHRAGVVKRWQGISKTNHRDTTKYCIQ